MRARETTGLRPATQELGKHSFESPCGVGAFVVNSEPHTGARPSARLCVGPEFARCANLLNSTLGPPKEKLVVELIRTLMA
jgi:hypothetical protein